MVLVPVETACALPDLWKCFGWAPAKDYLKGGRSIGECRVGEHLMLARLVQDCCGQGPGAGEWWKGLCPQEYME